MPVKNSPEDETLPGAATTLLPSGTPPAARRRGVGVAGRSGPPGNTNARTHGLHTLKKAVATLGGRVLSGRTRVGRQLAAWRADLAADLGGADQLSTQQRALLDEAVKLKLMLDSVDAWVLAQPSLVNKAKRALLPVVRERLALVGQLQSLLRDLGLGRRAREVPSLASYIEQQRPAGPSEPVTGTERGHEPRRGRA